MTTLPLASPEWEESFDPEAELKRLFPARRLDKVLLVLPPEGDREMFDYATAKRGRYWNMPPYGPGILATLLRRMGVEVAMVNLNHAVLKAAQASPGPESFDFTASWRTELERVLEDFRPDLVGVSCMFTQAHRSTVAVCQAVKAWNADLPLALGGVHITNCLQSREQFASVIADYAMVDLFFLYESELSFPAFVRAAKGETPAEELFQVHFNRVRAPQPQRRHEPPAGPDLDVTPAYDLMRIDELSDHGVIGSFFCLLEPRPRVATLLSNRGCRGRCTYCSVRNFNGRSVRQRPVSSVVDEMLLLRDRYGVGHLMWLDDDLLFNHQRALALFNEMVRRRVGMTWDCTNGVVAASCNEEIIAAAAESGCIGLNIGIESGNPDTLRGIKKPSSLQNFRDAAAVLRRFPQINTRGFLMIGFPGETYGMIADTHALAREMALDWYNITILQPLPNTPIFDLMVRQGLVEKTEADQVRFNSGPYGKHRQKIQRRAFDPLDARAFEHADPARVPERGELEAVWMHMNYHLNFRRLTEVEHPEKLRQQLAYTGFITRLVAPDDPFAMYFHGLLRRKSEGRAPAELIERLESCLAASEYWSGMFKQYGLSAADLRAGLPQRDAPR